ncbi:uncharacterized protein Z519_11250 [Cladophialophora bantiana CBS 173.52]|uniref:Major facilitator superfamily (MFS) profile domain-containing protein n=1 Tax=Cladophialophora bantiana (strain ATCC 10958 / CBS 173.52 / CDC B-1940 / NIH 8579) TaxID=1442370 RepID=A0A0D2HUC2_CLAB1|nr:uncharacterized protein Z519_11250 [Cladophialophora bantiana CBS 173.52]KIW88139.1 hypothetical protein Z519_11250 [Cladophialophora bantiana CBS 173.52]
MSSVEATKPHFSWRNFLMCFLVSIGVIGFGYPSAMVAPMLAKTSFLEFTGLGDEKGIHKSKTSLVGALGGIFQAGAVFGVILSTQITDRYGRKAAMLYCIFWSIVGGVGITAAPNLATILVFRFFSGMGSWGFLTVAPTYTAELSIPAYRGLTAGMCGVMLGLGYATASYFGLAFHYTDNRTAQWRGPAGLSLVWPMISLITLPFIPESPRFLLMKDRVDEAWRTVSQLHSPEDGSDQTYAREEFYQMKMQAQHDQKQDGSWRALFSKAYRKRVIIGCGLSFLGQSTAVLVIQNYAPIFYAALGFNSKQQIIIQSGRDSIAFVGNLVGAILLDRLGRRLMLLIGLAGCIVCVAINSAMVAEYSGTDNAAGLGVGIAALFVYLCFYASCYDAPLLVVLGEIFPNHVRAKGVALSIATVAASDILYLQVAPYAFAAVGWKFFLLFICVSVVGWIWLYFQFPETKGVPLEEMADLFGDKKEVVVHRADIHLDNFTPKLSTRQQDGPDGICPSELEKGETSNFHVECVSSLKDH